MSASATPYTALLYTAAAALLVPISYAFYLNCKTRDRLRITIMSKSSKGRSSAEDEKIVQFCGITGATPREAKRYIDKYNRVDMAVDSYYNELSSGRVAKSGSDARRQLASSINYPDGDDITVDGTIKLCEDLGVDPEDVVLLAVAYELKSPRVGEWARKGWIEGWKNVGCDTIATMKTALLRLRDKLGSDLGYFQKVYSYTFEFARAEGQRSLGLETAQAFWGLLLPHGLQGGALAHIRARDDDGDDNMQGEEDGWKEEYTQWWFDFLNEKGGKGVSKDTWLMVRPLSSLPFSFLDLPFSDPSRASAFRPFTSPGFSSSIPSVIIASLRLMP
ncbi:hypothetical protein EVG20_g9063 [Dentipellis fragilis]|uniref:Defective in cullin neddylation protein n=1 Tax=Dentipellis fragilis TaxID=205917 RepID=A0A4Y9Y0T4_9AGAM|nr:hypothetical protein EVG20_g9063 [Dentipellis fragilis]